MRDETAHPRLRLVVVAIPFGQDDCGERLRRGGRVLILIEVFVVGAPAAVAAIICAQTRAHSLVSLLLRRRIDGRIDGEAAEGDARRVLVFDVLPDLFNRILEPSVRCGRRRIVSRVSELDRFNFRGVRFRLRDEAVVGHQLQDKIAPLLGEFQADCR